MHRSGAWKANKKNKLEDTLKRASAATLYRHHSINAAYANKISRFALAQQGKSYDTLSATRSGLETGCNAPLFPSPVNFSSPVGLLIQVVDELRAWQKGGHDRSFFCSELIVRAYHHANLRLVDGLAHTATPRALVKSHYLKFVQELITA